MLFFSIIYYMNITLKSFSKYEFQMTFENSFYLLAFSFFYIHLKIKF